MNRLAMTAGTDQGTSRSMIFCLPLLAALALFGCGGGGGGGGNGNGGGSAKPTTQALVTTTARGEERVEFNGSELVSGPSAVASYEWRQLSGTSVGIDGSTAETVNFEAPDVTTTEQLEFELGAITEDGSAYIVPLELAVVNEKQVLAVEDDSYLLKKRAPNATCEAPAAPPVASRVRLKRVFPNIDATEALDMDQAPGDDSAWYVVYRNERKIRKFDNNNAVTEAQVVLDRSSGAAKINSLVFHPDFAVNGKIYVTIQNGARTTAVSNILEYTWSESLNAFDLASERLILSIDSPHENSDDNNHPGGTTHFGPDGYLYLGLGDYTRPGVFNSVSQETDNLWGSMLRIDVDSGEPYAIPPDNPFANGGGRPEIFAWGFRHPWKWSFDRLTGDIWAGDVGWVSREEVDKVVVGGNYGWPIREGSEECERCEINETDHGIAPDSLIEPLDDYDHDVGRSVTGGYVYRGQDIPELYGIYIYGDYVMGQVFALSDTGGGGYSRESLTQEDVGLGTFGEDIHGELYVIDFDNGGIYQLVRNDQVADTGDFPTTLSATGCVDMSDPLAVLPGMIPYTVQMPLWSDSAGKGRWMALPDGDKIAELEGSGGDLDFPAGTVLVKHFRLFNRLIETRLFMRHNDGQWAGYSYEWDDSQTEAYLLSGAKDKDVEGQQWHYPSRTECLQCHTEAAGRALGPTTRQLNTYQSHGDNLYGQLQMLEDIGLFAFEADSSLAFPTLDNTDAEVATRARAYLDSNCSGCHRPGGSSGRSTMDLRAETKLADMNICNAVPIVDDLGIPQARLLKPGNGESSIIHARMIDQGGYRMPPLGTSEVDEDGVRVIENWINSLDGCD
jgi:uncharacterized repeat protein (TIGR03806 family)